ncbi:glycoside hydrolase family 3 protein [Kutzneria albida]|uniref:Beta-glucosidase n=1 Tax=Kutzneria albida DSM 43870 TaxID=1449976 RepID=W5W702_9PSEU|nr:glycoside hydrolase family 3 C-terminal domain-containing protein [Kutzneria albida]AHH96647.1 beta-glucosidase [Kutzneria albida DSM 43870]
MQQHATIAELVGKLDLDTKAGLLAGQDIWTLPAVPEIGLRSVVMSDGPVGVRGVRWTPEDPSVVLPSPTALAATWDPELARRAGRLLAQEARRKGVHVLLAPTVNLHRTPLGGRHFECYSEDPLLTGLIGAGYVRGVQEGGVATTVKHFVANDSETERYTVDVRAEERTLRELYLRPFEIIVREARPWGVMAAYNGVNGSTMTEHARLQNEVLRAEWGFDGVIVSDWTAARDTVRAALGGMDLAMPGPHTVYGPALAQAVREGAVPEQVVDTMVARVLLLAARVGALDGVPSGFTAPEELDGNEVAREVAARSAVLVRNDNALLPLRAEDLRTVAVIGAAADEARILGGGSATVFPGEVVSPLAGLRAVLPGAEVRYCVGADPRTTLPPARDGFELTLVARDGAGAELASYAVPEAGLTWIGEVPEAVDAERVRAVEFTGTFTPEVGGSHEFGFRGLGEAVLTVNGRVLFDGVSLPEGDDPFTAAMDLSERRFRTDLVAGETVRVSLLLHPLTLAEGGAGPFVFVVTALGHAAPGPGPDAQIEQAVAVARESDVAVVVVSTTEEVESEGFDRTDLALPGRQDELVRRVAAANPRTVVVVNAGSPVEMPWLEQTGAVLLSWFPGQAAGTALAEVLLGAREPGGRLPTTWPARLADAPVVRVKPEQGVLHYEEGVFIGYRAWQRAGTAPAHWFGHGLGYTEWTYESARFDPASRTLEVELRNSGPRAGREVVQVYCAPGEPDPNRPARWLVGFAQVHAEPGESVLARVTVPGDATRVWDSGVGGWRQDTGPHLLEVGRSAGDLRLSVGTVNGL